MPSTYEKCPVEIRAQAQELIDKYHSRLTDAGVKIDYLFARAARDEETGDPVGPAIKVNGRQAEAYAKILGAKDRAVRPFDAEIVLDGDEWGNWDIERQNALLDHELEHLMPIEKSPGVWKTDDYGRPKLKMREHDYETGFFISVARRHGDWSGECRDAKQMMDEAGQWLWPSIAHDGVSLSDVLNDPLPKPKDGGVLYMPGQRVEVANGEEAAKLIIADAAKKFARDNRGAA